MPSGPIFIDTNYLVGLYHRRDQHDPAALRAAQLAADAPRLVTTDFVLIEFCRIFAANDPLCRRDAAKAVRKLRSTGNIDVVPCSRSLFDKAFALYESHQDKTWDVVDCASFTVMEERGIRDALTYDIHFVQRGYNALMRTS